MCGRGEWGRQHGKRLSLGPSRRHILGIPNSEMYERSLASKSNSEVTNFACTEFSCGDEMLGPGLPATGQGLA